MNLYHVYNVVVNALSDLCFDTCKHEIASDTLFRSNLEQRAIRFETNKNTRECLLCKRATQQSQFVSFPTLAQPLLIEWVCCVSLECAKHTPQLKLTNRVYRPAMWTARMNQNLFSVECIYSNVVDTRWEQIVDDSCDQQMPIELVHMICTYDPFHFAVFT